MTTLRRTPLCKHHRKRGTQCACGVVFYPCCDGGDVCHFCAPGGGDDEYRAHTAAHRITRNPDPTRPVRNTYSRARHVS